jgi:hypothetical protein
MLCIGGGSTVDDDGGQGGWVNGKARAKLVQPARTVPPRNEHPGVADYGGLD